MKSLMIRNGDIVLEAGEYREVSGEPKVRQDLGIAMREPYGCDRFHAQWGSLLDSYVGQPITAAAEGLIRAEVARLIKNYMAGQQTTMQSDELARRPSRMSSNEVIREVTAIKIDQDFDTIHVKISLTTLANQQVTLTSTARR